MEQCHVIMAVGDTSEGKMLSTQSKSKWIKFSAISNFTMLCRFTIHSKRYHSFSIHHSPLYVWICMRWTFVCRTIESTLVDSMDSKINIRIKMRLVNRSSPDPKYKCSWCVFVYNQMYEISLAKRNDDGEKVCFDAFPYLSLYLMLVLLPPATALAGLLCWRCQN